MTDNSFSGPTRTGFERHMQTAIQIVLVGLVAWMGSTTQTTAVEVAELKAELRSLRREMIELKEQTRQTYTRSDAERDFGVRDRRLDDLETRMRDLERHELKKD